MPAGSIRPPARTRRAAGAVLAWAALLAPPPSPAGALPGPLSVENLLRAPVALQIDVASRAGRIAWLVQEGPVQRIWTAELPGLAARILVERPPDDGRPVTAIRLSPDGRWLAYVVGLPANATGVDPNPASLVEPPARGLWLAPVAGGPPRLIGPGTDPDFSSDSRALTFVRDDRLLSLDLAGQPGEPAKQLLAVKGSIDQFAWSPDGRTLAFSNGRGRYAVIGLWTRGADRLRWISPEAAQDIAPTWSPDGNALAFLRMRGGELGRGHDVMDSAPFSVMVVDLAAGTARAVWTSPGPADSWIQESVPPCAVRWCAGGRLLVRSEHSGWTHLYAVSPDGRPAVPLTAGAFEVEGLALSPDGTSAILSSNEGNAERRRLWSVPLDSGSRKPLTGETTIDTDPVFFPDGVHYAYRTASAVSPQAVVVRSLADHSERRLGPEPGAAFPGGGLVEPRAVTFRAPDGAVIHGVLFSPLTPAAGKRSPGVVYVHGGPVRQMLLGWHPMLHYGFTYLLNQVLASRGYAVLAVNYRTGIGYGRAYREFPGRNTRGASEYQDVLAAGQCLQSLPGVDPKRLGVYGGSFGGYLTALALGRNSDVFKAGVDWNGVHNWDFWARRPEGGFLATDFGTNPDDPAQLEVARRSSGAAWVDTWRSPVLLIHGGDDRTVLVDETVDLAVKLRRKGVAVETLIFPDEQHGFALYESWKRALAATADFLDRRLAASPEKR